MDVALDNSGNLYISDALNHRIYRIQASERNPVLTTIVGTGREGFREGLAASAQLNAPVFIALDGRGNLFIADQFNHRVRRLDIQKGTVTTVAGEGNFGFSGDGGPAIEARLSQIRGLAIDVVRQILYISDPQNQRIRRVGLGDCVDDQSCIIETVAGGGAPEDGLGDGGAATSAELNTPEGLVVDGQGNLYIADSGQNRVRRVDFTTGDIDTVAGDGGAIPRGDGGPAISASVAAPLALAWIPTI